MNDGRRSGAEIFLQMLAAMDVDHIFASPGSEWAPVWEHLANPSLSSRLRYLSSRHEEVAVGMASGFAKTTGRFAAVMIHTTVGALHAAMALRGALHERVPMVVFAGESVAFGEDLGPDPGPQWLRNLADVGGPARLLERCAKWSFALNAKALLPSTIQRACQIAMAPPRGPVLISLPMEFLFEDFGGYVPLPAAIPLPSAADSGGIEELAKMLSTAKLPVIVSESAGRSTVAVKRLVELAELIGAPVVETRSPGCVNFPRTHPLHGGFDPLEALKESDLVFLVSTVAPWHPSSASPKAGAKVVVLDEEPLRTELPHLGYRVDLCLTGCVEKSLDLLIQRLTVIGAPASSLRGEHWTREHEERSQAWRRDALARKDCKPIDTRWVAFELNRLMPEDTIVVEETITHRPAILRCMNRLKAGSAFNGSVGGLGTGLGTALGIKVANPKSPVVALIGDGTLHYNPALAAFGFAQEHQAPILIVVFNNYGYLSQKMGIPEYNPDGWAVKSNTFVGTSITPSPDYAAIVRAFDGYGETIEESTHVGPALERGLKAIASGQLALLDVRLESVNH